MARLVAALMCLTLALPVVAQESDFRTQRIETEVQHELLMLPYYGIFDHLAFQVERGGFVRLLGQVATGSLKRDAERAVEDIPGVEQVINEIEILPASPNDDRIRLAIARNIYRAAPLERYGFQVNPSIHIVVKHGRVRLVGYVDNEADKTLAGFKVREVEGVFEVTNDLQVER